MPLRTVTGSVIAALLLGSCGIRLPIQTQKKDKRTVGRFQVRLESQPGKPAKDPDVLVWLIADKYHTGMVFPFDWLEESGFVAPAGFSRPKYVTMSWGNRNAYSREGIDNYWKMFRVLFTPTPAVMEMIPSDWNIAEVLPGQRIWRRLTPRHHGPELAAFLNKCSATGPDGKPVVICESSWGNGVQLESRYSYYIPRVCNVWTVQTIECLGGEINPWLALTADALVRQAGKPPNNFEQIWPGGTVTANPE